MPVGRSWVAPNGRLHAAGKAMIGISTHVTGRGRGRSVHARNMQEQEGSPGQ
jgi:hypothetical protein